MSLPHAILGFLQLLPMTGYDLKTQAFDTTVAHFWPAVQPQIYRELERMEELGWVTREVQVQTGRPNRHVYTTTAAGQAEFARWLASYQSPPAHREAFLIQLFFAAQLPNAAIRSLLMQQLQAHETRMAELQQITIPPSDDPLLQRQRTLMGLTRDLGVQLEQTYIAWLHSCLATVAALPE
ncbi:MAG: PadR family transcriptional regulator [Chloroflexaceae bacterium]|jgi:DNA-binding PadR family transcriptional regulator|nr:PadR family transcriptional regulator [Chloroflexaceae bacterium]